MSLIAVVRGLLPIVVASLASAGCIAGIHAGEVTKQNAAPDGLRYFLPATYFVVEQTAGGQWDARLEAVVDRSREYYVQPYAYLASGKSTVEFHPDGTLKSFRLESDSTAVPEAVITAIKDVQLKREELKQQEIEARAKAAAAGFSTREKQHMTGSDGDRAIFLYKLVGDKLLPTPDAKAAPAATVTFEITKADSPHVPTALGNEVSVEASEDRRTVMIGKSGVQLSAPAAKQSLCFYRQGVQGRLEPVTDERHDGLVAEGTRNARGGRLIFLTAELWDIQAIGLRQGGRCQPS